MDDPGRVRRLQRLENLDARGHGLIDRQGAALETCRQRLTLDELHHEELHVHAADCRRAQVVQRTHVRMGQLRRQARLAFEPFAALPVAGQIFREDFDGDGAVEARVTRAIHLAHSAGANQLDDVEVSEPAAGNQPRRRVDGVEEERQRAEKARRMRVSGEQ